MEAGTPLVSVIMPAFQSEKYIEAAIRSVMAQTVTDWELLVIDDGSTDGTAAIVSRLAREDRRVQLLQNNENLGAAESRNRGVECSRGNYLAFLDSDDLWMPQKLEIQLAALKNAGAELCCASYGIIDGAGKPSKKDYLVPERVTFSRLLLENVVGCSTVVLRRDALDTHRFPTGYLHEDYGLWLQLLKAGVTAVGCRQVLAQWRFRPGSRSGNKGKSAAGRWKIYRAHLRLPLYKAAFYFASYALLGLRKYSH